MTQQELFNKYSINETHNKWDSIDNWCSVEIYRLMHNGNLPPEKDDSVIWVLDFLNKAKEDTKWWGENVMIRNDWGSLYLTAKRMVYTLSHKIINDLNP